jgi:hypothetical protein
MQVGFAEARARRFGQPTKPSAEGRELGVPVPLQALIGLAETLRRQVGLPADRGPAVITRSRRNGERGLKRR